MKKISLVIDDKVESELDALKRCMLTENESYIVRVSIHEKFLSKNISNEIEPIYFSLTADISDLSGMDLDVVESHFVRFRKYHPTIEIYRAAIEAVKAEAAAKGEPVKNPEAALYGKLKQWATGKWKPTVSVGAVVPPPPGLKSQKEIEKELYGA